MILLVKFHLFRYRFTGVQPDSKENRKNGLSDSYQKYIISPPKEIEKPHQCFNQDNWLDMLRYNTIQYCCSTIQYSTIQYNTINFISQSWHINLKKIF